MSVIYQLTEADLQRLALHVLERHLTDEEVDRVREILAHSPTLEALFVRAIQVVTSGETAP